MSLSEQQISTYRETGHLTVPAIFTAAEADTLIADAQAWADATIAGMSEAERAWYLERGGVPRKLDNPVFHRPAYRRIAGHPALLACVEQLIGQGVRVPFSQIFFKPPEVGGPKPVHQDNFYFGCDDPDGMVTAWIAMDEATVENGCLFFGEGTNRGPIYPHVAPPGRPFDLQLTPEEAARHPMTPAPVPKGGVSFHHGNTLHQSSDNRSPRWRRAVAIHYVRNDVRFANPALTYDESLIVRIS